MIRANTKRLYVRNPDTGEFEPLIMATGQEVATIRAWLDEHPEATTTVLDGSITTDKLHDVLKLRTIKDYVTPQMFGAKGDGMTDDTEAIQRMFESSASNYYKFTGVYNTASVQIKNRNNIKIIGDGEIIGANAVFRFLNCNDLFISGLRGTRLSIEVSESENTQIIGNTLTGKDSGYDGIKLLNCTNYSVCSNIVSGFGVDGIKVSNADDVTITTKSNDGIIANNFIYGNADGGIDLYAGGKNVIVSGNFISSNKAGLTLKYTGTNAANELYAKDVLVKGNFISECNVLASVDMSNVYFSGNVFKNPINHSLLIGSIDKEYTYDNITIDGNTFICEGENTVSAVTVDKMEGITFANNKVDGFYRGITTSADKNTITNNDFKNVATPIQFNPANAVDNSMTVFGCSFSGVTNKCLNLLGDTIFENIILELNKWDGSGEVYDVNSVSFMYQQERNSWNKTYGATSERPTVAKYSVPLQMFFDTTLAKPIWRNKDNNAWIDATGSTV